MREYKTHLMLFAIGCVTLLTFLGYTEFYTKGEPREAIVSVTMLDSGNWILPTDNGCDIAYKPPFFHWCIAAASAVVGEVNEYTSRFPSAVALIAMTVATFAFYRRRRGESWRYSQRCSRLLTSRCIVQVWLAVWIWC